MTAAAVLGRWIAPLLFAGCALALAGCRQDMHDQPRFEPFEGSTFFQDGRSARPQVEGTIARDQLHRDTLLYTGQVDGKPAERFPFKITRKILDRGRERFEINCAPCHGLGGEGNGMVVQRGFRPPPALFSARLVKAPPGHFFDVITHGLGTMSDQVERVRVRDRWAIAAYIRVLQLSRNAKLEDVPVSERQALREEGR